MNGGKIKLLTLLAATALVLFCAGNVLAAASGACVNCHTMHNSQDGTSFMVDGTDGPAPALVRAASCYGCHGDTDLVNGTWEDFTNAPGRTPRINAQNYGDYGVSGDTLAGGSFYWVDPSGAGEGTPDRKGHNVVGVAEMDAVLKLQPPGWDPNFSANGQINGGAETWTTQLTCAGVTGCHGERLDDQGQPITDDFTAVKGGHHGNDDVLTGEEVATSYRFLKGIIGYEDPEWEFQPTASQHNQYYGVARKSDDQFDSKTISYLCAECHGDFHSGAGSKGADDGNWGAPWLRHPTDLDMNDLAATSEYADYNEGGSYSVVAPVASEDVSTVKSVVLAGAGDAVVTCISCHRAHGSPYDDLLRWAYTSEDGPHVMKAASGAGNVGCFICHTTKD
jgi:hypothetical protein